MKGANFKFLKHYTWLSNLALREGRTVFSVVPKFHYMCHLCQQARIINPRWTWCYGGEDFVGRISRLGHACLRGTASFKVGAASP